MATLADHVRAHSDLSEEDLDWLQRLVGDWQLVSDLSFADLVLWVPRRAGGFSAVAHCRPSTGATVYHDDVVGRALPEGRQAQLEQAMHDARIHRERDPEWEDDIPVREETIPVVRDGRVIAVLGRETNLAGARTPSRLELTYLGCADALARMIATGDFPLAGAPTGPRRGAPRVGDGLIRLDGEGLVVYASPNAQSAFHRLGLVGELTGRSLAEVTALLLASQNGQSSPMDETLPLVVTGRAPWHTDLEVRGTTLSMRALPLTVRQDGLPTRMGALLLLRDVSELRRRELDLLTKDATIREIHHRVKNNLQTVAALLRLQARRMAPGEARAALEEAMRRVATIALVHETLSQGIDESLEFDGVLDRTLSMASEIAVGGRVRVKRHGRFGRLPARVATPLALVLTELVTNAVEHGLKGRDGMVEVWTSRQTMTADDDTTRWTSPSDESLVVAVPQEGTRLLVEVTDDGNGIPDDYRPGLGLQIVHTLVSSELQGTIRFRPRPDGGTRVVLQLPLDDETPIPGQKGRFG